MSQKGRSNTDLLKNRPDKYKKSPSFRASLCIFHFYVATCILNEEWPKFKSNKREHKTTPQQVKSYKCKNNICLLLKAKSLSMMWKKYKKSCKKWLRTTLKVNSRHEMHTSMDFYKISMKEHSTQVRRR